MMSLYLRRLNQEFRENFEERRALKVPLPRLQK